MTEPGDVPDVPSAVVGWRAWTVGNRDAAGEPELVSPLQNSVWPAGEATVATCTVVGTHRPPATGCRCGLYAVTAPDTMMGVRFDGVIGAVALWGDVVEGTQGWRASRGYPRVLVASPTMGEGLRARLAQRYGVPVHRSPVELNDLVALLSTTCRQEADGLRAGTTTWAELEAAVVANRHRVPPPATPGLPRARVGWGRAAGVVTLGALLPAVVGGLYGLLLRAGVGSPLVIVAWGIAACAAVLIGVGSGVSRQYDLRPDAPASVLLIAVAGPVQALSAGVTVTLGWQPGSWALVAASALVVLNSWRAVLRGMPPPAGRRTPGVLLLLAVSAAALVPEALAGAYAVPGPAPPALLAPVTAATGPEKLSVPLDSATGLAFSPDGRAAYVADNTADAPLTAVDTATGTTTATIPVGAPSSRVAVSPDGRRLYVTAEGTAQQPGAVVVVDTATHAVVSRIPVGIEPLDVVLAPDGRHAYVSNGGTSVQPGVTVSVIDTATGTITATVPVVSSPGRMAISPDGSRLYVPGEGSSTSAGSAMTVLDATTGTTRTVVVGDWGPVIATAAPDGRHVYVVCDGAAGRPGSVRVLDTVTGVVTRLGTVAVRHPSEAALTPDGRTLVLPDTGLDSDSEAPVSLVDTVTGAVRTMTVPGRPYGVAITPNGQEAWVTSYDHRLWRVPLAPGG